MKYYTRAVKTVFKYAKAPGFYLIVMCILSGCILPLQTYVLKRLIDTAAGSARSQLWFWLGLLVALILSGLLKNYCQQWGDLKLRVTLSQTFEKDILDHLNKISYSCIEDPYAHDVINRFSSPADQAAEAFEGLLLLPQQVITLAGTSVLFVSVSPYFLLGMAVLFSVSSYFSARETLNLRKLRVKQTNAERKSNYVADLFTDRSAAKELRMFGIGQYLLDMYGAMTGQMIDERNRIRRRGFIGGMVSQLMNMLFVVVGIAALVVLALKGRATVPQVIALSTSLPGLSFVASWGFPDSISEYKRHSDTWKDYSDMMALPVNDTGAATGIPDDLAITFKDVHFAYPGTGREVLRGLNMSIKSNEKTAIVGRNGSGKSTLVKLLLGLYPVSSGQILIGKTNMADISIEDRHKLFSAVFQDFTTYEMSVEENIVLSNLREKGNKEKIAQAVKTGSCEELVERLPDKLETPLGRLEEAGVSLSGGEGQRLALSRVLFSDAEYLILDEPTAAMDPKAECEMYENLMSVIKERSCIIISHRLATAKMADRIILIEDGRVLESGPHNELVAGNGLYARMYREQAVWYQDGGEVCADEQA